MTQQIIEKEMECRNRRIARWRLRTSRSHALFAPCGEIPPSDLLQILVGSRAVEKQIQWPFQAYVSCRQIQIGTRCRPGGKWKVNRASTH